MATADRDEQLDLNKFNSIIEEYSSSFKNPPKNARQLVQFCKDKEYNYKYGELNPFYLIWNKQQSTKTTKGGNTTTTIGGDETCENSENEETEINWNAFWDEYQENYKYPPKKAIHLWNFAKEEKFVNVKYKEARIAFDKIHAEKTVSSPIPIEGHIRSNTDSGGIKSASTSSFDLAVTKDDKIDLILKVTKYTSSTDLEEIKTKFLELLNGFRSSILHDPVSSLQLFNFINEDTQYRVRYGDVKKCYNYAVKHKWFKPMKRMKKINKKKIAIKKDEGLHSNDDNDDNNDEGVEFVLEVDHEKIEMEKKKEEEEKKEIVALEIMSDEQFDEILSEYNIKYKNPPRNASQIMNFAKEEINQHFKYKACRIAFNRWKNYRGAVMPKVIKTKEPGQVKDDDDDDVEDEEEEEEEDEEEEESD